MPRFLFLLSSQNPKTTVHKQDHFYDDNFVYETIENNFRIAVAIEGTLEKVSKINGEFVKLFARISGYRNGSTFSKQIEMHECTEEDYKDFFEIESGSRHLLEQLKANPQRGMRCINWKKEGLSFFGNENTYEHSVLEVFLLPCNHAVSHLNGTTTENVVCNPNQQIQ